MYGMCQVIKKCDENNEQVGVAKQNFFNRVVPQKKNSSLCTSRGRSFFVFI